MASLLVFIDPERAKTLLSADRRNSGRSWMIERTQLAPDAVPQLDRLDEDATLFICTIENDRVIIIATVDDPELADGKFTGGEALLRDYDITDLAPRLGSTGDLRQWSSVPRILPPSDVDLLRYTIGLANDLARAPAAPEPIIDHDATADELRAAVFADPASDEARAIYADYLQSRGDPRGELIALQLARATSGAAVSDRERTLVERYGRDCVFPLNPVLVRHELDRGFLFRAEVVEVELSDNYVSHPAWATVDSLSATDVRLLCSQHIRARRLCIRGDELRHLARAPQPLPYETIVGIGGRGVTTSLGWADIMAIGSLRALRTLSVDYQTFGTHVRNFFRSPLCKQLDQLDVFLQPNPAAPALREAYDRSELTRLTVRFALMNKGVPMHVLLAFQRSTREPILTLQVSNVFERDHRIELMRFLAPLTRGIARIALNDIAVPADVEVRHAALLERLATVFSRVVARPGESLAP